MTEPADLPVFPPGSAVTQVIATSRRPAHGGEYFVMLSPMTARRLAVADLAVLAFFHPALGDPVADGRTDRFLAIHCRVHIDRALPDDVIAVDQTLRNALGIPFRVFAKISNLTLYVLPAERGWWDRVRLGFAGIFGFRYLAVRCQSAHVTDIEKNYARLPGDVLKALGAQEADDVRIERPMAVRGADGIIRRFHVVATRLSALVASEGLIAQRESLQRAFPERYPNSQVQLYDYAAFARAGNLPDALTNDTARPPEPDVPPIFMDAQARDTAVSRYPGNMRADFLTPFLVRRSVLSAIARDAIQTSIAFLITLVQFTLAFDLDAGRISLREGLLALAVAGSVGTGLIVARLRQQV